MAIEQLPYHLRRALGIDVGQEAHQLHRGVGIGAQQRIADLARGAAIGVFGQDARHAARHPVVALDDHRHEHRHCPRWIHLGQRACRAQRNDRAAVAEEWRQHIEHASVMQMTQGDDGHRAVVVAAAQHALRRFLQTHTVTQPGKTARIGFDQ
ncbi:hypothetical protein D3C81_1269720 [compost metagenome]